MPKNKADKKKSPKPNIPAKTYSADETRKMIQRVNTIVASPENILKSVSKLLDQYEAASPKDKKAMGEKTNLELSKAITLFSLDNHYLSSMTTGENYRTFLMEFTDELYKEFNCKTPIEKSLAQTAAMSFVRTLEFGHILSSFARQDYTTKEKNAYYTNIGKEVDRAHRHYISALTTLKQLKSPNLSVTVKTEAAFIANNQQINATERKERSDEIIEPK